MTDEKKFVSDAVHEAVRNAAAFRKLVLAGDRRNRRDAGEKTVLEPVNVSGERKYRIVTSGAGGEAAKVIAPEELDAAVDALLDAPFRHLHLLTAAAEMHVRISKKGRYLVSRGRGRQKERLEVRELDREKPRLVNPENSRELFEALGMLSRGGKIKPTMYAKFRQVNRFLELLGDLPVLARAREGHALNVLDCGCGKAYLTFALYHYLRNLRGVRASIAGVDRNAGLIAECNALRGKLRYEELDFRAADVAGLVPFEKLDVVLSLHACDLATDEAIAKGVNVDASAIVAVPCCQHELHDAIEQEIMKPVLRHGILRERTADILTDALRAMVLRIAGYRAEVIEFIDPDATSKNVMIRAQRADAASGAGYLREFRALCDFWGVRPKLVEMLDGPHRKIFEAG